MSYQTHVVFLLLLSVLMLLFWLTLGSSNVNVIYIFQYIQQNIRSDCSNIDKILEPPEGQDEGVWKYEHLRYV